MKKHFYILNLIIIFCALLCTKYGYAQLGFCNGNSGDPIFTETFGTGTLNSTLPAGTTTYAYANGFPNDGFYTVDNGTFGNVYDWHQTEDHTPGDTNGKCLIVNAGFSAGEFYRTNVSGLCESTTYEFSAWLLNLVIAGTFCSTQPSGSIPVNVRFEIWDSTDTNLLASGDTGNITETASPNWQEFGLVFQTLPGETAVILKMINNGNGGCGNDLAIDDIEFKTCGDFISISDTSSFDTVTLCSSQTPYSTMLTVTPDNSVFSSYFYQWETSTDGITWTDISGETAQSAALTGITNSGFYRAKVAESAVNLSNTSCYVTSEIFEVIVNQLPAAPTIECWETATVNTATCSWDVTGSQPIQPTLECWETATFNTTTCVWDVTGSQPVQPTIECWEVATFNNTTCIWDITGTQPTQPAIECWETVTFNTTTCVWDVSGTQPAQPSGLECWEVATFNNTTCVWDITGTQPIQPTLECWEIATLNNTTCVWDVSGTQPAQPTGLECWEVATFNNTTCIWDITGTQPTQPTLECWETATFNNTTCVWDVVGNQPAQPTGLECWENATFNNTSCAWEVSGTQPVQPTGLECWEVATFNDTTCLWEVSGDQPIDVTEVDVAFCENEDLDLQAVSTITNPMYTWSTGEMTEFITVDQPGVYTVEITDGCSTTNSTFNVEEIETPIINTIESVGNSIVVTTSNFGNFEYSLDGISFQSSNVFEPVEGGQYTIYVRSFGCDTVVTSTFIHFYIPQFFTPNGDTKNETFNIKGLEYYQSSEVYIFDRYGKLLKSVKNAPVSWDGTFNGSPLPTSDYWYVIIIDGQRRVGHFTLKR
ncbi:T9SS type B sorting domain-containing protein [Olleya sp. YS]|uniref:T9SS type B sorting domain-containing protein n=1 Tax=Olleya sp. YS TaxID=3028318 RepID=UPI00243426C9|nr:T9SS type B sorting domain-containing protein [Olleya sp. YS]WGD35931.1 T9SS type B sorting domain-containing protein [Olleya sp. YS]